MQGGEEDLSVWLRGNGFSDLHAAFSLLFQQVLHLWSARGYMHVCQTCVIILKLNHSVVVNLTLKEEEKVQPFLIKSAEPKV